MEKWRYEQLQTVTKSGAVESRDNNGWPAFVGSPKDRKAQTDISHKCILIQLHTWLCEGAPQMDKDRLAVSTCQNKHEEVALKGACNVFHGLEKYYWWKKNAKEAFYGVHNSTAIRVDENVLLFSTMYRLMLMA